MCDVCLYINMYMKGLRGLLCAGHCSKIFTGILSHLLLTRMNKVHTIATLF